jgi:ElaA protein
MRTSVAWQWRRFAELSPSELYALLAARSEVFVVEQRCQFLDADGHDVHAWHLLGWASEPAVLAAYLRLLEPGSKYVEPSIGRVLTTVAFRGCGLGRDAMLEGLRQAAAQFPGRAVRVAAQARLERFYLSLGFRPISQPYQEDGIAHVDMLRPAIDLAGADH